MPRLRDVVLGVAGAVVTRALFRQALLVKFRHDLAMLNAGDYRPLLAGFADDAVLDFHEGEHRWSGEHRGRAAIERFFQEFVAAGVQGEIVDALIGGPPWRLRVAARFDDHADDADGLTVYRNRAVLVVTTRWGRIVRQEDFFTDTARIAVFDQHLTRTGRRPSAG